LERPANCTRARDRRLLLKRGNPTIVHILKKKLNGGARCGILCI
jgi:hypothetical protein